MSAPLTAPASDRGRSLTAPLFRLAPNQHDLYIADRMADDATTYHVSVAFRVDHDLDVPRLRLRLERLLVEHPVLAGRVAETPDGWFMEPAPEVPRVHLAATALEADGEAARRRLRHQCERPLDPHTGPLIRVALLPHTDGTADLLVVAHHLVTDEGSIEIIGRRLLGLDVPEIGESYRAWSETAHERMRLGEDRRRELKAELREADWAPVMAWARSEDPAPTARTTTGGSVELPMSRAAWDRVRTAAAGLAVTPYSLALAAAGLVLGRNCGGSRPVLGATVSQRTPRHTSTVGYFSSTVAIPLTLDEGVTVASFLRRTHQRSLRAYRDAYLPLSAVLPEDAEAGPRLVVVPVPTPPEPHGAHTTYPARQIADATTAQFPLALYLHHEADGSLRVVLRYQHAVVDHWAAELFGRQFCHVLDLMIDMPEAPLDAISTVPAADETRLLRHGRGPSLPDNASAPADLPALFTAQVRLAPGRTAVTHERNSIPYAELETRATDLAQALVEYGVRPGDRVGVCLPRGIDQVTALLGVLKSGAAYVPLDPDYPPDRLTFIAADTGLRITVGEPGAVRNLRAARTLPVTARPSAPQELPEISPDATAYVIHTSGSTGRPKGVYVSHRNVVALLNATTAEFGLGPQDVWTHFHSFAFDFSVWEIWGCLLTGGRLVVVPHDVSRDPEELHRTLAAEAVTVFSQTPSAFTQLLAADAFSDGGLSVRLLIFGGEPLDAGILLPWFDRYPESRCRPVNMYGITETTVHCTRRDLTRADALNSSRSVGRPLPGWQLYVLDPRGRLAAPGVPGEIHVGGAGVSAGYLDRPELTTERFVTGLLADSPDERLYRSGDRGRFLPNGELEHLGRLDDQVKIRGHRIELGEIRSALLEDARVVAAVAVVRQTGDAATAAVHAYVVLSAPDDAVAEIRQRMADRLPHYLVPATLTAVAELPLTPNGKLDQARLPATLPPSSPNPPAVQPRQPAPPAGGTAAASSDGEARSAERMAEIWQAVLDVPVGVDDTFFELGGNSLLAVRLSAALKQQGFLGIQLRDIFRNPTPQRLAGVLHTQRTGT